MSYMGIHKIQAFPQTCLNRDESGRPKTTMFGGYQRIEFSSQSIKREIRMGCRVDPRFQGVRTKELPSLISSLLPDLSEANVLKISKKISLDLVGGKEDSISEDGKEKKGKKTQLYMSEQEWKAIANALMNEKADAKTDYGKILEEADVDDNIDILIFGRMMANSDDKGMNIEGASCFSRGITTHKASPEIDFFASVDDIKEKMGVKGSSHIGNQMFGSGCFYSCTYLNLDMLKSHLPKMPSKEFREVVELFTRKTISAVPKARKGSMFGFTLPSFVMVTVGDVQPLSLANAFEQPISLFGGEKEESISDRSAKAMVEHFENLRKTYCLNYKMVIDIPSKTIDEAIDEIKSNI